MPAATALASSLADPSHTGKTMAFVQRRSSILGQSIGPLLGGTLRAWMRIRPTFIFAGIIMLVNTCIIAIGVKTNGPKSNKTRYMHILPDIKQAFQSKGAGLIAYVEELLRLWGLLCQ